MDWSDYYAFYVYDENTSSTVPVEVSDIPELSEQELEFIYDDKVRKYGTHRRRNGIFP